jgi:AcrR family transcriptional regulator
MSPDAQTPRPAYAEGRDALLDAAIRVVARDGLSGLTYRTVAREAGTTHGLVSYHFRSRDRLIEEAVARASRAAIEGSSLVPESGEIDDFAANLRTLTEQSPEEQILQFELALEGLRKPELRDQIRALYAEYLRVTAQALHSVGITPVPSLTRLVFAALDGLTLHQLIDGDGEATDAALAELQAILGRVRAPDQPPKP